MNMEESFVQSQLRTHFYRNVRNDIEALFAAKDEPISFREIVRSIQATGKYYPYVLTQSYASRVLKKLVAENHLVQIENNYSKAKIVDM